MFQKSQWGSDSWWQNLQKTGPAGEVFNKRESVKEPSGGQDPVRGTLGGGAQFEEPSRVGIQG